MRTLLFLAVALGLFSTSFAQQCYTDPLTGQTVCQQPTRAKPLANIVKSQPVRSAVRGVYQSVSNVRASGNCTGAQSYGSNGSAAWVTSYGSIGSAVVSYGPWVVVSSRQISANCGCANCTCTNCQCGVSQAPAVSSNAVSAQFLGRKTSRQVILAAVNKAEAAGMLGVQQAKDIKRAISSPRMLKRIEDLLLQNAHESGKYSLPLDRNGDVDVAAVDWDQFFGSLAEFIEFLIEIAPKIIELIDLFTAYEKAGDLQGMRRVEQQIDHIAMIHWQARRAC